MADSAKLTARQRLLDIAVALALEGGPAALAGRALTTLAGASPSAVNYHFGGRAGLLRAVHAQLATRQAAWRRARLAEAEAARGSPAWAFVAGAICDLASGAAPERLALLEFGGIAGATDAGLQSAVRNDEREHAAFWGSASQALGRSADEAEIWAAIASCATRLALLDESAATRFSWLGLALLRLQERLEGRATPAEIPWLAPATGPRPPERPAGAQRLVDAALRIISDQGLQAATLRAIAEGAGLSLGSATYFFASKAAIIHAAFTQLRDQACSAALEAIHRAGGSLNAALRSEADGMLQPSRGFDALYLAGARSPDLRPVALSLRSLVGQTSATWLDARRPGAYDRLDSFVWSLVVTGAVEAVAWGAPAEPAAPLGERLAQAADRLFPAAPNSA